MKRIISLCAILLLSFTLLTGCVRSLPSEVTVDEGTLVFSGDRSSGTITHKDIVYKYSSGDTRVSITYPNGSTYTEMDHGNGASSGGWRNGDGDGFMFPSEHGYLDQNVLIDAIQSRQPRTTNGGVIAAGILFIVTGLWGAVAPRSQWRARDGWRFKNAEPSEIGLLIGRIASILAVILGIAMLVLPGILGA